MDLRQAHAILATARVLEAADLGIEMHPFDHAAPGNLNSYGDDYMTGCAEYTNSDGRGARVYNIDLYSGPEQGQVTARVESGFADTGYVLLHSSVHMPSGSEQFNDEPPRVLAGRVMATIEEYEMKVELEFKRIVERES